MVRRIILIFIVIVLIFTFLGISLAGLGTFIVHYPAWLVDLYSKMPDGSAFTLNSFGSYVLNNLYAMTPVGWLACYGKFQAYDGLPPRSNLSNELDRTVYAIYGSIMYANGEDPARVGAASIDHFYTYLTFQKDWNSRFDVILQFPYTLIGRFNGNPYTMVDYPDYARIDYIKFEPILDDEHRIWIKPTFRPSGENFGYSLPVGMFESVCPSISRINSPYPFEVRLYIDDNYYKSYICDQLLTYNDQLVYSFNPFEIADATIVNNASYLFGSKFHCYLYSIHSSD